MKNAAITDSLQVASTTFHVPLRRIRESPFNHRSVWGSLEEFERGVDLAALARKVPVDEEGRDIELVFGHRRFRGAQKYQHETLVLEVRETMTDIEVIEAQLVENNRTDPHPLDEADWYRDLHETHGVSVEEIAAKVARSTKYVHQRLQLHALSVAARTAFSKGEMSLGRALLLARFPDHALQNKVLDEIVDDGEFHTVSIADARDVLSRMAVPLVKAVFDRKDADLVPAAGACTECIHNSDTTKDLFAELDAPKAVCTKPGCFKEKEKAFVQLRIDKAKDQGKEVLTASQAKKALQKVGGYGQEDRYEPRAGGDTIDLKAVVEGDKKGRTYEKLLGADARKAAVIAVDPTGKLHELLSKEKAKEIMKEAGIKLKLPSKPKASGNSPINWQAQQRQEELEREIRRATHQEALPILLENIRSEKYAVIDALRFLLSASRATERLDDAVYKAFGVTKKGLAAWIESEANPADLANFTLCAIVGTEAYGHYPDTFLASCKKRKVDLKKIEARKRAELKVPKEDGKGASPSPTAHASDDIDPDEA